MQATCWAVEQPGDLGRRRRSEAGQGTFEYIIIIGLVVVVLAGSMFIFRKQLGGVMHGVTGKIAAWVKGDGPEQLIRRAEGVMNQAAATTAE